jgi:hypothetical protein
MTASGAPAAAAGGVQIDMLARRTGKKGQRMRGGMVILDLFAAVWAAAAILVAHHPLWWVAAPVAISAAILLWARTKGGAAGASPGHVGRIVGIWSAVEGVAMFLAANVLINSGHSDAVMPAFAIIVGLHFVPLARGFPLPLYYATGAAMVLAGTGALLLPGAERGPVAGLASALILWVTSILLAGPRGAIGGRATV